MSVFKITYVNNEPISCSWVMGKAIEGQYTYEYYKDSLIYAIVKARNEEEAIEIGKTISTTFQRMKKALPAESPRASQLNHNYQGK